MKKYVESLPIDVNFKTIILEKEFIDANASIYLYYPFLFIEYFEYKDIEKVEKLSIAGFLYFKSLILLDKIFDSKKNSKDSLGVLLASVCQEEAIKILAELFPINSEFWILWNKRKEEYLYANKIEKIKKKISWKQYKKLASLKSAFGKCAIDALHILSKNKRQEITDKLLESHNIFSVAMQLNDDIVDISEDFGNDQFNWAYFKTKKLLIKDGINIYDVDLLKLKNYMYVYGIDVILRRYSILHLRKAKAIVELKYNTLWTEKLGLAINENLKLIENSIAYIEILKVKRHLLNRNNKSINLKLPNFKNNVLVNGLKYILNEFKNDFGEIKHIMYLPKSQGFSNRNEIHVGDIFQKAMLCCNLLNIQKNTNINLRPIIDCEIEYIIENRLKDKVGVWSYFPSVKEISPDIDDLGQILFLLIISSNKELIYKYCMQGINIVENDLICSDGGIETWILPSRNRTKLQQKQNLYNETKWGKGPDVEVMANYLYGLSLFDDKKYDLTIKNGLLYILSKQNIQGYWESRWYFGSYYGTYICLKLFHINNLHYPESDKALNFIKSKQNKDGGWGLNFKESDPLSTAFCILSLDLFENTRVDNYILKGFKYLKSCQLEDGSFNATPFIKPRGIESYKSKILTTSYALYALSIK
ncbi:MAG: prenyltransferase/squalene oxidase repeat-containing protein [Bacteroidota bacterium]|nr:prenyltransferase/squalene oxidase repeat-containing protein [Bacteroidota bacterium]